MDHKTVSAKMPVDEVLLFRNFCKKKGVSPSGLIRDMILRELEVPIPHTVAGKNKIRYDKENDKFIWSVALDSGEEIDILTNISPAFLEDLLDMIGDGLGERASFIGKTKKDSAPVPSNILRAQRNGV